MIKPTVGRVVWYWPDGAGGPEAQPYAAIIAYVWSDRLINIGYFDQDGEHDNEISVVLVQEGDPRPASRFCEWMPYQMGQAAKTEALQAQLSGDVKS